MQRLKNVNLNRLKLHSNIGGYWVLKTGATFLWYHFPDDYIIINKKYEKEDTVKSINKYQKGLILETIKNEMHRYYIITGEELEGGKF